MEAKIFGDKKIIIRKLSTRDLKMVPCWLSYINDLINEDVYLTVSKKFSVAQERTWLQGELKKIKARQNILLAAQDGNRIVGSAAINLLAGKQRHVGQLGISLSKDYRGIGLGTFMIKKIIDLAKKEIVTAPKIISLGVFVENKIARNLYKKAGFKEVARIPKSFLHKGRLMDEIVMQLYL